MVGEKNPFHVKQGRGRGSDDDEMRNMEAENEATWRGPGEEMRDVRKAGGGVRGTSLGGAHTGRYGPAPAKVASDRERKLRGQERESED